MQHIGRCNSEGHAGTFGNNIEKEPQKSHPKLKKYAHYIFIENIC